MFPTNTTLDGGLVDILAVRGAWRRILARLWAAFRRFGTLMLSRFRMANALPFFPGNMYIVMNQVSIILVG